jgi:hypothetical protein
MGRGCCCSAGVGWCTAAAAATGWITDVHGLRDRCELCGLHEQSVGWMDVELLACREHLVGVTCMPFAASSFNGTLDSLGR